MANISIQNNDVGAVAVRNEELTDGTLTSPGASVIIPKGTLLAVLTAAPAGNWVVWANGGADGSQLAVAVLPYEFETPAAGDGSVRAIVSGTVNKNRLVEYATGTGANVDEENIRQLQDNGIVALDVEQLDRVDNPQP